jgi:hypothetical protein
VAQCSARLFLVAAEERATRAATNTRHFGGLLVACVAEVGRVSQASRLRVLEAEGLLHPRADAVTAAVFTEGGFFLSAELPGGGVVT